MVPATVIAIDGRPASPAMAAALAQIDARCRAENARAASRKARIDADPRTIALRAVKASLQIEHRYGMAGGLQVFEGLASGRIALAARIGRLLRARVAQLDKDHVTAGLCLREAAVCRHGSVRPVAMVEAARVAA